MLNDIKIGDIVSFIGNKPKIYYNLTSNDLGLVLREFSLNPKNKNMVQFFSNGYIKYIPVTNKKNKGKLYINEEKEETKIFHIDWENSQENYNLPRFYEIWLIKQQKKVIFWKENLKKVSKK